MPRFTTALLLVGATLLASGCANSVLNDPQEMARRHAETQRQTDAWNRYWSRGTSIGSGGGGGGSASASPSVRTMESPRCYQVSRTRQVCYN